MTRVVVLSACFAMCALVLAGGCQEKEATGMDGEKAIEIARRQAEHLGYDVDAMSVRVRRDEESFVVYFFPPRDRLGGDLVVRVDAQTGSILGFERGQ